MNRAKSVLEVKAGEAQEGSESTISTGRGMRPVTWVLLCTVLAYIIANVPLLYSLLYGLGPSGIGKVWGFSPHTFLFLTMVFPLIAFLTFASLHLMVGPYAASLGGVRAGDWVSRHWGIVVVATLGLSCFITVIVYFAHPRNFHVLKPAYAYMAVDAFWRLDHELSEADAQQASALARSWRRQAEGLKRVVFPAGAPRDATIVPFLSELPPAQVLGVVQDEKLQLDLGLVDRAVFGLTTVQELVAIFVGLCAVLTAGLCLLLPHVAAGAGNEAVLSKAMYGVFGALFLFGVYSFLYQHQREQLDRLIGAQPTAMPAFFTALVIGVLLVFLSLAFARSDGKTDLTALVVKLPFALGLGLAAVKEDQLAPFVRKIGGVETTAATQWLWAVVFLVALVAALVWMLVGGLVPAGTGGGPAPPAPTR